MRRPPLRVIRAPQSPIARGRRPISIRFSDATARRLVSGFVRYAVRTLVGLSAAEVGASSFREAIVSSWQSPDEPGPPVVVVSVLAVVESEEAARAQRATFERLAALARADWTTAEIEEYRTTIRYSIESTADETL